LPPTRQPVAATSAVTDRGCGSGGRLRRRCPPRRVAQRRRRHQESRAVGGGRDDGGGGRRTDLGGGRGGTDGPPADGGNGRPGRQHADRPHAVVSRSGGRQAAPLQAGGAGGRRAGGRRGGRGRGRARGGGVGDRRFAVFRRQSFALATGAGDYAIAVGADNRVGSGRRRGGCVAGDDGGPEACGRPTRRRPSSGQWHRRGQLAAEGVAACRRAAGRRAAGRTQVSFVRISATARTEVQQTLRA